MKIVIAPNAFKGTLSAVEAAGAMAEGVRRAAPDSVIVRRPVSDGGDGFLEVMTEALEGEVRRVRVSDPLDRPLDAPLHWRAVDGLALIEMARASGLALLHPEERDPFRATTRGTGELVKHALKLGARRIVVGIGGSATCDGGTGMAHALGIRFLDASGKSRIPRAGALSEIARIDAAGLARGLRDIPVEVLCDVDSPLLGDQGAARIYAPQKGASPGQVELLEAGLRHLAGLMQRDLGVDATRVPGGGAAGGLGAGFYAFLGAKLRPGTETVLEMVGLEESLEEADLVLTGEGRLDGQTLQGKAPLGVARMAGARGIPCVAIAGRVCGDPALFKEAGFRKIYSLCGEEATVEESMRRTGPLLAEAAGKAVREMGASRQR